MSLTDTRLPAPLYTADSCRELDRIAIAEQGIPGIVLMKRAGRYAYGQLSARWPGAEPITVFCGSGNNAGDGYIVAALAAQQNRSVRIIQLGHPARLQGDAAKAHDFAQQAQVPMETWRDDLELEQGVVVDALLGTGAKGAPRGDYGKAISRINESGLPVLALDLPSGLDADSGHTAGECICAELTVSFIGLKQGLFTGGAPALTGDIRFSDLGVPAPVYEAVAPSAWRIDPESGRQLLPPRPADAHKGKYGHVLVVGGDLGTGGAALMAAESASRVGAGLVSVATRAEHCASFLARRPELMVRGVEQGRDLKPLLERASVLVVGPGLGQTDWSRQLLAAALDSGLPLVVDADGLNLISKEPELFGGKREWVLTPHPGEAARLLNSDTARVQQDRFGAVAALQQRFGGAVVLKGAGSLVASAGDQAPRIALSNTGNPGMASGGMGDILSGVLGGLLAQGLDLAQAAELGVVLHGRAADLAALAGGERGMLATDLLPHLRELVNS